MFANIGFWVSVVPAPAEAAVVGNLASFLAMLVNGEGGGFVGLELDLTLTHLTAEMAFTCHRGL